MNKGRRTEITNLKYKKRLKIYGLKIGEWTALKSHGSPCSCGVCRSEKYRDKDRNKNKLKAPEFPKDRIEYPS